MSSEKAPTELVTKRNNSGFQTLRAVACIGILLAHSAAYAEMNNGLEYACALDFWGRYGLLNFTDIFFGLTGYLISAQILRGGNSVPAFIKKRVLRIYPGFFAAFFIAVLTYTSVLGTYSLPKSAIIGLTLLPIRGAGFILNVEWTLVYQMVFYLLCLPFMTDKTKKYYLPFLALWCVCIAAGTYLLSLPCTAIIEFPKILLSQRNFAFISGALAYLAAGRIKKRPSQPMTAFLFCAGLLLFLANYQYLYIMPVGKVANYVLLSAILISASMLERNPRALVYIGDRSYGIYLIHALILNASFYSLAECGIREGLTSFSISIAAAFIFGLTFGSVELAAGNALRKFAKHRWITKRTLAITALLLCIPTFFFILHEKTFAPVEIKARSFDSSAVAEKEGHVCGWVDTINCEAAAGGSVKISLDGWAYDPVSNELTDGALAVVDGEVLPSKLKWYSREGVAKATGNPVLTKCGFSIVAKEVRLSKGEHKVEIYARLKDGRYMQLEYAKDNTIRVP